MQEGIERLADVPSRSLGRHKRRSPGPGEGHVSKKGGNRVRRKETRMEENPEETSESQRKESQASPLDRH